METHQTKRKFNFDEEKKIIKTLGRFFLCSFIHLLPNVANKKKKVNPVTGLVKPPLHTHSHNEKQYPEHINLTILFSFTVYLQTVNIVVTWIKLDRQCVFPFKYRLTLTTTMWKVQSCGCTKSHMSWIRISIPF